MSKENEQKRVFKVTTVQIVLWAICIALIVVALLSKAIFPATSYFYALSSANFTDAFVKDMFDFAISPIIVSAIYVSAVYLISSLLRLCLAMILNKSKRGKTIDKMIDSFIKYASAIVIVLLVLATWGVDTTALLASAGILGLVIGLGAQSLISDIISGIFIVFEGSYQVGDIVVIDGYRGEVTEIGMRTTKIIDAGGNLKIINNSNITTVVNMTNDLSLATCDVDIEYGESLEKVERIIKDNLPDVKNEIKAIKKGPFYLGVTALGASGVTLRFAANCEEAEKFQTCRDLNREIKLMFDRNNINIPFTQVVLHQPQEFTQASQKDKREADTFVKEQRQKTKRLNSEDEQ